MLINLTPHDVTIKGMLLFPKSGTVARVEVEEVVVGVYRCVNEDNSMCHLEGDIPVVSSVYGNVKGLPDYNGRDQYIVSAMVLERVDRTDVFCPTDLIRDEAGVIIGANKLRCSNKFLQ